MSVQNCSGDWHGEKLCAYCQKLNITTMLLIYINIEYKSRIREGEGAGEREAHVGCEMLNNTRQ